MSALRQSRAFRGRLALKVEVRRARRVSWAYTHDVSVNGLCISGPIRPAIDERFGLTLTSPAGLPISLPAEVRWTRDEGMRSCAVGVRLIHTLETRKALQKLSWEIETGMSLSSEPRRRRPASR